MKNIYLLLLFVTGIAGAQIVTIPDANFKNKLISIGVDTNSDGDIQVPEAEAVTETLELGYSSISNLTGISAFTNMKNLRCAGNNLSSLTLTGLPNLKVIDCESNNMTSLTVTNLASIDTLNCSNNMLTSLNVATLSSLKRLSCYDNHISTLDVSNNTQLIDLWCSSNWLGMGALIIPASNVIEFLDCSSNGLASINVNGLTSLKYFYCTNNNLSTLTVSGLPNLEMLLCGNNILNSGLSLNNLPVLKRLECGGSTLGTLNVSGFPTLEYLDCNAAHLTSLNVAGLTNLNYLTAGNNELTTINVTTNTGLTILTCSANQLTSLDISALVNLSNLHCGQNQITALDLSTNTMLHELDFGANLLTAADVSMLPDLEWLICDNNQLTTLDCSNNHHLTWISCFANQLQAIYIKNGSDEFFSDASWIENPNLAYICADETQINNIQSQVDGSIAVNSYCSFTPGGDHNTIAGLVRFDANNDGCNSGDVTPPFIKLNITDGTESGATFSLADSSYAFYTAAGSFTITPDLENPLFFNVTPASAVIDFPAVDNSVVTQNFCLSANGVHPDLEIVVAPVVPARPGFDAVYKIVYRNKGNQTMTQQYGVSFSYNQNLMNFVSATQAVSSQNSGTITWDFANLTPFESRSIEVVMHINPPTDANPVNVGDVLILTGIVMPQASDENVQDNIFIFNQTVVGSYDPNNLVCVEGDVVSPTEIGNDLHYIANFENTGTDVAENIVVKMAIDETQFDVNSLRILGSSHSAGIKVTGNIAEYIFKEINLGIGGHGNILLKMKSDDGLTAGATVSNKADIYFDYNLPVATNDANTTFQLLGVGEHEIDNSISIYPNPANNVIHIQASTDIKSVQLYDVQGRLLQMSLRDEPSVTMDISDKQSGIYFVKITSDKGTKTQKFIKQ